MPAEICASYCFADLMLDDREDSVLNERNIIENE